MIAKVTRKKNQGRVLLLLRVSTIQIQVKSHLLETHSKVGPLQSIQLLRPRNLLYRKPQEAV